MGWCSGSDAYIGAKGFNSIYNMLINAGTNLGNERLEEVFIEAFRQLAVELQNMDWDCEDEALEEFNDSSPAYKGLAIAMGINLECPGQCFEIRCSEDRGCGCPCHVDG